ncbi:MULTISPECIES: hypothetical protein [Streptomyces]|uniref:hypothetical protein n=1 Tax=Streptomyces TaxID=1883 RepID=UPI00223B5EF6|nr:hypothetical protein [Streptomyces fungicidicus]
MGARQGGEGSLPGMVQYSRPEVMRPFSTVQKATATWVPTSSWSTRPSETTVLPCAMTCGSWTVQPSG